MGVMLNGERKTVNLVTGIGRRFDSFCSNQAR